jgi:hypothetical protein
MRNRLLLLCTCISVVLLSSPAPAQQAGKSTRSESSANTEMNRLARAFTGDWNTVEAMERSEFFPDGGGRQGTARFRLGSGGSTLIEEGSSDGSAGRLDFFIVVWWDKRAKLYRFFTCFNDVSKPCEIRGTAHWESDSDTFVNDYEETVKGKSIRMRDAFSISRQSITLVASIATASGTMKPLITTKYTRKP